MDGGAENTGKRDGDAEVVFVTEQRSALLEQPPSGLAALWKKQWVQGFFVAGTAIGMLVAGGYLMDISKELDDRSRSWSQMSEIGEAVLLYAEDYDQTLPPADTWEDGTKAFARGDFLWEHPRSDNVAPREERGYGFNAKLGGRKLDAVGPRSLLPIIHEVRSDGPNALADPANPLITRRMTLVGFADGEVKMMPPAEYSKLNWTPK